MLNGHDLTVMIEFRFCDDSKSVNQYARPTILPKN